MHVKRQNGYFLPNKNENKKKPQEHMRVRLLSVKEAKILKTTKMGAENKIQKLESRIWRLELQMGRVVKRTIYGRVTLFIWIQQI